VLDAVARLAERPVSILVAREDLPTAEDTVDVAISRPIPARARLHAKSRSERSNRVDASDLLRAIHEDHGQVLDSHPKV
jgi:hypothetical protein